jgi:predicted lipoprotein with Yx(FWY)xxD motif
MTVVRRAAALPVLFVALVGLAGCGQSVDEGPTPQLAGTDTTLQVRPSFYGATLADGTGRTLYQFAGDSAGRPTCNDACAEVWKPYLANGEPRSADGNKNALNDDQIGTITRNDGRAQVTYAGHPLYYYAEDGAPGDPVRPTDIRGAGLNQFGGVWSAVSGSGAPVAPTSPVIAPL